MTPFVVASLLFCGVLADPIPKRSSTPIVNKPIDRGVNTEIDVYPFLASIQLNKTHVCGGSVISDSIILTAAHCVTGHPLDSLSVQAGSTDLREGGSRHGIVEARIHEGYLANLGYPLNDLALLRVSPPLEFSRNVSNVLLAKGKDGVAPGTVASVAGWGQTDDEDEVTGRLMQTSLSVIEGRKCARDHGDVSGRWMSANGLICAAKPDAKTCLGDPGSPLMNGWTQIGISTWGSGCIDPNYQGVYLNVALYYDWIRKNSVELSQPEETVR